MVDGKWVTSHASPTVKTAEGWLNNEYNGGHQSDIRYCRQVLNQMHLETTSLKAEIFMHQQTDEIVVVTRQFGF